MLYRHQYKSSWKTKSMKKHLERVWEDIVVFSLPIKTPAIPSVCPPEEVLLKSNIIYHLKGKEKEFE